MILPYKKYVNLQVNLEIGEKVTTGFYLREIDKIRTIEDIRLYPPCESGVMVKVTGINDPIDSGWLVKVDQQELNFEDTL